MQSITHTVLRIVMAKVVETMEDIFFVQGDYAYNLHSRLLETATLIWTR